MHNMRDFLNISKELFESELEKSDVESIFSTASITPKNWIGKSPESKDSLINKWKNSRFPTDSRDIIDILKKSGYNNSAITKVFKQAGYGSSEDVAVSPAINDLSKYIIKAGYTAEILSFLEAEFPDLEEAFVKDGKLAIESVRYIFDEITNEDATELPKIKKQHQIDNLGRSKK